VALSTCGADDGPGTLPPREFEPVVAPGFFGINGQALRPLAEDGDVALLDRHLAQLAAGGVDFVRANVDWPRLEPMPPRRDGHRYDFSGLDAWVRALSLHGLSWSAVVMGVPTPQWAADPGALKVCGSRAVPRRSADVAALAGALARRYGHRGTFWRQNTELTPRPVSEYELWNEPNLGSFWCPLPDPAAYAAVADASADAIDAADPRATLVLGGLAAFHRTEFVAPGDAHHAVTGFLDRMLAARPELRRKLDVIGVHAYGAAPRGVLDRLAEQRRAIDATALRGKPLSFNETGWYTSGIGPLPPVDEEQRAAYLAETTDAVARSNCGLASFAPHTWTTREVDPLDIEDFYGIADPKSGDPYPSADAYISQVLLFEGRGPEPPPAQLARICD
jgi:hypothetical protein